MIPTGLALAMIAMAFALGYSLGRGAPEEDDS
jgi:hypothetical protein